MDRLICRGASAGGTDAPAASPAPLASACLTFGKVAAR